MIKRPTILALIATTLFSLHLPQLHAAGDVWSGSGGSGTWSNAGNWVGGTSPVNGTNLIFTGTSQPNNTNDLSSLTNGWMTFNNGGFVLNGNALTLNGSSALFTNSAGTNIINLNLNIPSASSQNWNIASGSELRIAGTVSDAAAANPLGSFIGGGTLRITSANFTSTRMLTTFNGTLIIDGATVNIANDGFRFSPTNASQTAAGIITNNAFYQFSGSSSLRIGQLQSGLAAGTASLNVSSGTILLLPSGDNGVPSYGGCLTLGENPGVTATVTQNGGLVWLNPLANEEGDNNCGNLIYGANAAGGSGTYNLNGGTLILRGFLNANPGGTAVFNFNGGTLVPVASSTTFMPNVIVANVKSGGAIIDTTNNNITIAQNLAAGSPGGGLTKLGAGTLTLSGNNTYTGNTVVSNGALNVTGNNSGSGAVTISSSGTLSGSGVVAGAVSVQPGGTVWPGSASGRPVTLTLQNNLALSGNLGVDVNESLSPSNDLTVVNGTLTNAGTGTLTVVNSGPAFQVGDSFQIFNQPLPNGGALSILPNPPAPGELWNNQLAVNGTIGIVSSLGTNTGANLVNLSLSAGTLAPAFNSNIVIYAASVAYTNNSVTVTPTSLNANATIQVIHSGTTNLLMSGTPSGALTLNPGTNVIDVRVTSADASAVRDYVVTVTRVRPNIILILADDQGFSDWSCYGGEIQTPNLDSLASSGLRFRNFFNHARCSPTRCAILTGLYTQQAATDPSASLPPLRTDNNITIAELLGANGYHTYMAGKWHLGSGTGQLPWERGFDEVFTYASGSADHEDEWTPSDYTFNSVDGETTNINYDTTPTNSFYQPDAIGDYCLQFLKSHDTLHTNSPFFMYVPFGTAHFDLQAPQAMVDTNVSLYTNGWDAVRYARYTNMLAMGVIDSRYALSPNEGTAPWNGVPAEVIPAWNTLDANRQADLCRRMAIYATMIEKMDANIGRVVQYLQQNGELDNTLIMVLSDNGCNYEGGVYGLTGSTSDATPLTGVNLENMGLSNQPAIYLGGGWAHVSNTPFRWFKHFVHNGGTATPFIVHWPQGVTRTNQWENEYGDIIDVMSTIADVTGVSYPTQFNGHTVVPMQGISLKPWFATAQADVPRSIGYEHEGNRAYISGNWKFVTKNFTSFDYDTVSNELELYDLSTDPSETTNLAYSQTAILGQMETNWNNWCVYVGDASNVLLLTPTNNSFMLTPLAPAQEPGDLFVDTFNRPDSTNLSASATGMWGSDVPPLGAGNAYYPGYEGSGLPSSIEIRDGSLLMANGPGMSEDGIMYNFDGQDILNAGGFSVELNVQAIETDPSDAANRYVGYGVGLTQAQAASGGDIDDSLAPGQVTFRGAVGANTGVSPFFVDLNLNGDIEVWTNGVLVNSVSVGATTGILTTSFACTGFTTNDPVIANVFFDGQLVNINPNGTNPAGLTFNWINNDNNYIGLSARASDYAQMDNLAIRKLPLAAGLVTDYAMSFGLTGTNSAPTADPDGDGVNNFAEWAFGGNPTVPDAYLAGFKSIQVLPGNDFRFVFQRYINYAAVGLQYQFLVSTNLINWTPVTPNILSSDPNEDNTYYDVITMELPAAVTTGQSNLFLRIEANTTN